MLEKYKNGILCNTVKEYLRIVLENTAEGTYSEHLPSHVHVHYPDDCYIRFNIIQHPRLYYQIQQRLTLVGESMDDQIIRSDTAGAPTDRIKW